MQTTIKGKRSTWTKLSMISTLIWTRTYSLKLLPHITILAYQLRHLFLQPVILLHQQLVHGRQFPVHGLESRGLFPLLLPTSAKKANIILIRPPNFNLTRKNDFFLPKLNRNSKYSENQVEILCGQIGCSGKGLQFTHVSAFDLKICKFKIVRNVVLGEK